MGCVKYAPTSPPGKQGRYREIGTWPACPVLCAATDGLHSGGESVGGIGVIVLCPPSCLCPQASWEPPLAVGAELPPGELGGPR